MRTFAIATLGCKVNAYESESYVEGLKRKGYTEVDFKEEADVYVINTCAVTNTATSKSRQKINAAKKRNPNAVICVVGCVVQTSVNKDELGADILVGSAQKQHVADYIDEILVSHRPIDVVTTRKEIHDFENVDVHSFENKTRAFLKIQDGCNQFCSYCIIPFARGKERSLKKEDVLIQAKKLIASGHKEIVLTGIHLGRYGLDVGTSLFELLKELCEVDGLERIRISSIEVTEVSDEIIELMKNNKKLGRNLHIPLQSGSDTILKSMRRPYSVNDFVERVNYIREELPDCSISSDLILGFPGETQELFEETKKVIEQLDLSFLHVFPYSKRDGTLSCTYPDHLENKVKKERCKQISEISKKQHAAYRNRWLHKEVEVLYEYEKDGYMYGHTNEYELVKKKGDNSLANTFAKEFVISIDDTTLLV